MSDAAMVQLSLAQQALGECRTVMEAKHIADVAEAARIYLERTNASVETVNRAAEIRTLAERQMGEFLAVMPKATGVRMNGGGETPVVVADDRRETLREIGITKDQSSRAQKLAAIPAPEFRGRIEALKANGERLTMGKVLAPEKAAKPVKPEPFRMPDRGLIIARGAVSHLQTILPGDGERVAALTHVLNWCKRELNKARE